MRRALIIAVLAFGLASPAWAETSAVEQELLQVRQKMSHSFAEAVNNKDAVRAADHYANDIVFSALSPVQAVVVGREAMLKRWDGIFKAGSVTDYSSKPGEVHLVSDGVAWSTGTYTFTAVGKDGAKRQVHGNWLDMLRREADGEWRVTFQAVAAVP